MANVRRDRLLVAMAKYMIVSNMKMYAWISADEEVEGLPDEFAKGRDEDAAAATTMTTIIRPPEKRLPKSRKVERDGLGDLFDDVDRRESGVGLGVVAK